VTFHENPSVSDGRTGGHYEVSSHVSQIALWTRLKPRET